MKIHFTKMHGAGNDYIYVDVQECPIADPERLAALWSDRHKGIGSDGLVLICPGDAECDFRMRMFNNDGSEGRMCGNAARCIGKYVFEHGLTDKREVRLGTLAGVKILQLHVDDAGKVQEVVVDMGEPALDVPTQFVGGETVEGEAHTFAITSTTGERVEGTFVSTGNPHFVVFVQDVDHLDVAAVGPTIEFAEVFPERVNVEFAEVKADGSVRMRVWERGSGITMACGTGACATATAAHLTHRAGRENTAIVMDGGTLHITWREADNRLYMAGPATEVFTGEIEA